MMLSVGVTLIGSVALRVYGVLKEKRFLLSRERARLAALSGVDLVVSRLSGKNEKEALEQNSRWLLENYDRWIVLPVMGNDDTQNEKIVLRVQPEDGKINLNAFYNSDKKVFTLPKVSAGTTSFAGSFFKAFDEIAKGIGFEKFYETLQALLKERKEPLVDMSEMFSLESVKSERITLFPPLPSFGEGGSIDTPLALSDFFVMAPIVQKGLQLWPLHFSSGMMQVLGLAPWPVDEKERAEVAKDLLKRLGNKPVIWNQQWNNLVGKPFKKSWSDISKLGLDAGEALEKSSRASFVSVVSYGVVGGVTQGVYAILRLYQGVDSSYVYTVTRLYWI